MGGRGCRVDMCVGRGWRRNGVMRVASLETRATRSMKDWGTRDGRKSEWKSGLWRSRGR